MRKMMQTEFLLAECSQFLKLNPSPNTCVWVNLLSELI